MKSFYDHLLLIEEITVVLDKHDLKQSERKKFISLILKTMHHTALEVILTHLPKQHHQEFLDKFSRTPYDPQLLLFIQEKISTNIEKELLRVVEKKKKELLKEINNARNAIG